jgi:hypothetical protein
MTQNESCLLQLWSRLFFRFSFVYILRCMKDYGSGGSTIVLITLWFPPCFAFWVPECLWVVRVHTVQRMHHVLLSSSDGIPMKLLLTHWMIRTWSKWDVSSCPPQLLYFWSAVLFSYWGQVSFMIWPQIILLIPMDK